MTLLKEKVAHFCANFVFLYLFAMVLPPHRPAFEHLYRGTAGQRRRWKNDLRDFDLVGTAGRCLRYFKKRLPEPEIMSRISGRSMESCALIVASMAADGASRSDSVFRLDAVQNPVSLKSGRILIGF